MSARPLTGRKVALIMAGAFAVIVGANAALVIAAAGTFPGLAVANSYVASQQFDDRLAALRARDWTVAAAVEPDALRLSVRDRDGRPVRGLTVTARFGRPASAATDRLLTLTETGDGYAAPVGTGPGRWEAAFEIRDGTGETISLDATLEREVVR